MTVEPRINSFCWVELASNNTELAKKFYTELLGWTYKEEQLPEGMGSYITAMANGLPAAAMFSMQSEEFKKMGILPHWGSYIRVDNCDQALAKALTFDARVLRPAFDCMDIGRMAVIQDPCGAVVHLWEKKKTAGAAVQNNAEGAFCWNELLVADPSIALTFYNAMFGWSAEISEFGGNTYYSLKHPDASPAGGIRQIPAEMPNIPPHWGVYFTVRDVDKAMAYIKNNGGAVHFGPQDIHGMGKFAACQDPEGAAFSVFEFTGA